MLIGFSFQNYTSFYNENIFTMKAGIDKQFKSINTIKTPYGELLKSAFIWGANGSGKSNFILAIETMKKIVLAEPSKQISYISNPNCFALHEESKDKPTLFEITFIKDEIMFEYGFEILQGEVNKEYLYKKKERKTEIFNRTSPDFNDIDVNSDMKNVKDLRKNTRRDSLFLYWANLGNNEIAMKVHRWFESIQIFDADNTNKLLQSTIEYSSKSIVEKNNILDFLKKADINIVDFDYEINTNENNNLSNKFTKKNIIEKNSSSIVTKHKGYIGDWKPTSDVTTDISFESAGTKKLFEIAGPIIKALENGDLLLIDEIDSRLHPSIVRFLVMMFNSISKNQNNAQLICTTHDVLLLDDEIRRDQIYFTEKDMYGVSHLYPLSDFKNVRKDSRLLKQYLLGSFGATPNLQDYFTIKTN